MLCKRNFIFSLVVVFLVFGFSMSSLASERGKININTASLEELAALEKVGEKYAQRIVEYREANGPFERPEDIMKVKGIGERTWEANKDKICVK